MSGRNLIGVIIAVAILFPMERVLASSVPADYPTIQEALDNALPGEVITVADGTYMENLLWPEVDGITLCSASGDFETCIIDGSAIPEPVITASFASAISMTMENVTVQGGTQVAESSAGGVSIVSTAQGATALLQGNQIRDNTGSGVYADGFDLTILSSIISGNVMHPDHPSMGLVLWNGDFELGYNFILNNETGGLIIQNDSVDVSVDIHGNVISFNWGGMALMGTGNFSGAITGNFIGHNHMPLWTTMTEVTGGIGVLGWTYEDQVLSLEIVGNEIVDNVVAEDPDLQDFCMGLAIIWMGSMDGTYIGNNTISSHHGDFATGILVMAKYGNMTIEGNRVQNNIAYEYGGGGIGVHGNMEGTTNFTVTNNIITGNSYAGIATSTNGEPGTHIVNITNNTIADNLGKGIENYDEYPVTVTVTNCIVWGNGDSLVNVSATYSDIEDGDPGEGNISEDPLFLSVPEYEYHLQAGSPCIDTGSNAAPDLPAADYDGDPRIVNGTADMGADEYVENTPTGDDVEVAFPDQEAAITFESVTEEGQTTVDKHVGFPELPDDFLLLNMPPYVYDIESDAAYSGDIVVCVVYDDSAGFVDESAIRLFHEEDGNYVDRTILPVDTENNIVCALVTDFSRFAAGVSDAECWDNDGDGYDDEACGGDDCDDADAGVNPGMAGQDCLETPDGIDNDCDGQIDEDQCQGCFIGAVR